jgi:spore maturation protein B
MGLILYQKTTNQGGMYEVKYLFSLIIPLIFLTTFLMASVKKVKVYDSFTEGMKGAIPLVVSIFPYIAAVTMLSMFLEVSGFGERLNGWLAPAYNFIGIPEELAPLMLIKPLSGSGSIAVLGELLEKYGVDSYIGRCACVLYGSSETVFYIGAVYFAGIKRKKLTAALCISLVSFVISVIFGCFLCNFL